jgi:transcriptional regulator with XRE-family HTH domain
MTKTVGTIIREAREAKQLTLRELARQLDVSAAFWSDVEHDRRGSKSHWDKLVELLGVSYLDLEFARLRAGIQESEVCYCWACGAPHRKWSKI